MAEPEDKNEELLKFLELICSIDQKQRAALKTFEDRFATIGKHIKLSNELANTSAKARKHYNKTNKQEVQELAKKLKEEAVDEFIPLLDKAYWFEKEESGFVEQQNHITPTIKNIFSQDYNRIHKEIETPQYRGKTFQKLREIMDIIKEDFQEIHTDEEINNKIRQALENSRRLTEEIKARIKQEIELLNQFFYEGGLDETRTKKLEETEKKLIKTVREITQLQRQEKEEVLPQFQRLLDNRWKIDDKIRTHLLIRFAEKTNLLGKLKNIFHKNKITIEDVKTDIRSLTSKPEEVQRYVMKIKSYWNLLDKEAKHFVDKVYDVADFKRKAQEGTIDYLMQIGSKKAFDKKIEEETTRNQRYKTPFSLIMMDIDFFKDFNTRYGHAVGDRVLKEIADVIKRNIRKGVDSAYRYGGEEIAVILSNTKKDDAGLVAKKIRVMVKKESRERIMPEINAELKKEDIREITISQGVADMPTDAETTKELIKQADLALEVSKRAGRDRTTIVIPGLHEALKKMPEATRTKEEPTKQTVQEKS